VEGIEKERRRYGFFFFIRFEPSRTSLTSSLLFSSLLFSSLLFSLTSSLLSGKLITQIHEIETSLANFDGDGDLLAQRM